MREYCHPKIATNSHPTTTIYVLQTRSSAFRMVVIAIRWEPAKCLRSLHRVTLWLTFRCIYRPVPGFRLFRRPSYCGMHFWGTQNIGRWWIVSTSVCLWLIRYSIVQNDHDSPRRNQGGGRRSMLLSLGWFPSVRRICERFGSDLGGLR